MGNHLQQEPLACTVEEAHFGTVARFVHRSWDAGDDDDSCCSVAERSPFAVAVGDLLDVRWVALADVILVAKQKHRSGKLLVGEPVGVAAGLVVIVERAGWKAKLGLSLRSAVVMWDLRSFVAMGTAYSLDSYWDAGVLHGHWSEAAGVVLVAAKESLYLA